MVTAVTGIIYDKDKGILFEKRTDNGMWCVPGGAIEIGETLEEALKREIKEETSLDIYNPQFFCVKANVHMVYPNEDEVYYTDVVYIIDEYEGELNPDSESEKLVWFKIDNLPDNIISTQIDYINNIIEKINKK